MKHVWSVRVRAEEKNDFLVHARNHAVRVGEPLSFDTSSKLPSALEQVLGAFASDLLGTLQTYARRRRVAIDAAEVSLNCRLENALVHLGVVGEEGSPRIESIDGTVYLSSDAEEAEVQALWEECLLRSPLYNTLKDAIDLRLRLCHTP